MLQSVRIRPHHTIVALALLSLFAAPARAGECGNVDAMGQCLDAQTLAWCAEGKLKQATCPKGEICAAHQTFNGGVGCLPPEKTSCGSVPTEGQCTSAGAVAWCDNRGKVQVQSCGSDSVCGWDDESAYYDCLPVPAGPRTTRPDGGAAADAGSSDSADSYGGNDASDASNGAPEETSQEIGPSADVASADGPTGPTPGIAPGASKGETVATADSACAGGGAPGALGWLFALLALMATATRRPRYSPASSRKIVPRSPTA
jgi:hypothetical protein